MTLALVFDQWNRVKKKIATRQKTVFFTEREVWWCSLGKNIGHEQDGKNYWFERPVLIIKKFNQSSFLAIPLSSKSRANPYHHQYTFRQIQRSAIFSQVRMLDQKRLLRKIGKMTEKDFQIIRQKIKTML